jgi:uroporphyrinogen-III synthase
VNPQVRVPEPNTWREIVPILAGRLERRISVQEPGGSNPEFLDALRALGAEVTTVSAYRWELPEDPSPLRNAARRIVGAEYDVVVFTTSIQLVHLLRVAASMDLERQVVRALAEEQVVASVGPIVNAALAERGLVPDIVPARPKMGALIRAAAESAAQTLARKRALRAM